EQGVGHAEEIEKLEREERRHTCGLVEVGGGWWRLVKVTSTLLHHPPPSSTILYCPHREHQHEHPRRNARPDDRPQPRRPRRQEPPRAARSQHRSAMIHPPLHPEG